MRLELGVFLPDLLRTILQSQSPQNGDASVHHVDLAERVNVHLEGVLIQRKTIKSKSIKQHFNLNIRSVMLKPVLSKKFEHSLQ